jgi:predicted acyl esterase
MTRRRFAAFCAAALLASLVTGPAIAQATSSSSTTTPWRPSWWSYDRPVGYQQALSHIAVPVRDGTPIGCDLSLPATSSGAAAPGQFPGVFAEFTPYYTSRSSVDSGKGMYFASHGYAVLTCSVRGTGDSGGTYQGCCAQPLEAQDGYDLIEWMARQPWSNRRIGMEGVSYGGMSTVAVAALHPPHLTAIVPAQFDDSIYLDHVYPGGIKTTPGSRDIWPEAAAVSAVRPELAAQVESTWLAHPTIDSYWNNADARTKFTSIDVPDLVINAGRPDVFFRGSLDAVYAGLVRHKPNAWMIVGPWQHGAWSGTTYQQLPMGMELAWFDHWLLTMPTAPLPPASQKLVSYEEGANGRGWETLNNWPPSDVESSKLYLSSSSGLTSEPGTGDTQSYTGQTPAGSAGYSGGSPNAQPGGSLTYNSPPAGQDTVLAGDIKVHLEAASSAEDANLYAEVWDIAPDGTATFVDDGQLKGSHRQSNVSPTPLVPNLGYDFDFSVWSVNWRFAAGHHLHLKLSGGSADFFLPPEATPTTVKVFLGGTDPSYLELPVQTRR